MKKKKGISLIIGAIIFGLAVGGYLLLFGGVMMVIVGATANSPKFLKIFVGFIRAVSSSIVGYGVAWYCEHIVRKIRRYYVRETSTQQRIATPPPH